MAGDCQEIALPAIAMTNAPTALPRVMLVSMVPPRNDCGVRIVMYRHLVERAPFDLHVASNADFADDLLIHTRLRLPWLVEKIRKSRFGPALKKWITDYENFIWPLTGCRALERAVDAFRPDVILTLAETGVSEMARKMAKRRGVPLAGLFLDWFPVMEGHFGHEWTRGHLSERYRKLYSACDVAICTSEGMQEMLGTHRNSHVVYPMPGKHVVPDRIFPPKTGKFRLVYVGAAERFYGRMLRELWHEMQKQPDMELIIVGPHGDWPEEDKKKAKDTGVTLGLMPPEKAAEVIAGADALLVVMSFEKEHELFMRTSFTTKWLDYAAFGKPVILWGPDYCSPSRVAVRENAAVVVQDPNPAIVVASLSEVQKRREIRDNFAAASRRLSEALFNAGNLQEVFISELRKISVSA
jgi:glycosyltransferase involved in cell wall biosynthesis